MVGYLSLRLAEPEKVNGKTIPTVQLNEFKRMNQTLDRIANRLDSIRILKSSVHKDKIQRFKKETQEYFLPIANSTDDNLVFKLSVAMYELK